MQRSKTSRFILVILAAIALTLPAIAQDDRGKAELNTINGKITIDYGRPQLKGRDPLSWQKDGTFWRMGSNATTIFESPVELTFGSVKVAKGKFSLWLEKVNADQYRLVFNSDTPSMGMSHDAAKDVAAVALKKESLTAPVEVFTIELKATPKGGTFIMTWATAKLSADFQIGK